MRVELDEAQAGCLEEYSEITGRNFGDCLAEALDDWIRTVAVEVYHPEKSNVIMFPTGPTVIMRPEVA